MLILAIFRAKIAQKTVFRIFRMVGPIKSTKRVAPRQNIENLGQESARKSLVPPLCGLIGMNQYFSRVSLKYSRDLYIRDKNVGPIRDKIPYVRTKKSENIR